MPLLNLSYLTMFLRLKGLLLMHCLTNSVMHSTNPKCSIYFLLLEINYLQNFLLYLNYMYLPNLNLVQQHPSILDKFHHKRPYIQYQLALLRQSFGIALNRGTQVFEASQCHLEYNLHLQQVP